MKKGQNMRNSVYIYCVTFNVSSLSGLVFVLKKEKSYDFTLLNLFSQNLKKKNHVIAALEWVVAADWSRWW